MGKSLVVALSVVVALLLPPCAGAGQESVPPECQQRVQLHCDTGLPDVPVYCYSDAAKLAECRLFYVDSAVRVFLKDVPAPERNSYLAMDRAVRGLTLQTCNKNNPDGATCYAKQTATYTDRLIRQYRLTPDPHSSVIFNPPPPPSPTPPPAVEQPAPRAATDSGGFVKWVLLAALLPLAFFLAKKAKVTGFDVWAFIRILDNVSSVALRIMVIIIGTVPALLSATAIYYLGLPDFASLWDDSILSLGFIYAAGWSFLAVTSVGLFALSVRSLLYGFRLGSGTNDGLHGTTRRVTPRDLQGHFRE